MLRLTRYSSGLACGICLILLLLPACGRQAAPTDAASESSTEPVGHGPDPLTFELDTVDPAVAQLIRDARRAVQADKKSGEAWGRLGMALLAHDLFQPAASCLSEAARLNSHDPRWSYFAAIAMKSADPARAVEKMRGAVAQFGPQAAEPRIRLANLLLELEMVDEAEELINALLVIKPDEARAHLTLAKVQLLRNQPRAALTSLNSASTNQSPDRRGLLLAAEAHRRLGQVEEAEKKSALAARASEAGPVDPYFTEVLKLRTGLKAGLSMADQLYVRGRVRESIQQLQQLTGDYPDSEWARILLARGLIRMRRIKEAQAALQEAMQLNPESFEAHFRMGVSYQVSGQHERAAEWFEKTTALQPASAVAFKNLGMCRFTLKEMKAAEAALKRSVRAQPNYFDGYLTLGDFYAQQGRFADARQALQAARRLRPDDQRIPAMIRQLDEELESRN